MSLCYAIGAERALLQAALRARFYKGQGFIDKIEQFTALPFFQKSENWVIV
jgi:hypothetical protein